jgi:hypothetical protein
MAEIRHTAVASGNLSIYIVLERAITPRTVT